MVKHNSKIVLPTSVQGPTLPLVLLSFDLNNQIEFSFFEGVIYNRYNDSLGVVSPNFSFYLPIIGSGLVNIGNKRNPNLIYGMNWNYQPYDHWCIYNQLAIRSSSLMGFQIGVKLLSPFNLKRSFFNWEFNIMPNGLYSVDSIDILQQYSHMRHELAHPLGSGLTEWTLKGQLMIKNLFWRPNYSYFLIEDSGGGFANQVFTLNESMPFSVSSKQSLFNFNNSIGIYFNKVTNMELSIGHTARWLDKELENYVFVSWRTYLKNDYFDQ